METRYVKANTHEKCWHNIDGIRKKAQSEFICFLLKIHSMCLIFPFSIVHSDDDETFHVSKTTRREILCANKAAPNGRLKKAPSKRKRETLSTHLTGEQPFDTTYLTPLIVVAERRTNCRHPASWMDGWMWRDLPTINRKHPQIVGPRKFLARSFWRSSEKGKTTAHEHPAESSAVTVTIPHKSIYGGAAW